MYAGLLVQKAEGSQLASLGHSLCREERMSRREEVAGKKFNMTLKKICVMLRVCSHCLLRMEDKQGLSGASRGGEGRAALPASGSCALSSALPSVVGLFFFKEKKTSH